MIHSSHTYTHTHIHTHTCTNTHTHTHTHAHTYTYPHIHTHIHIHIYIYTYIHTYTHIHIHTYTYTPTHNMIHPLYCAVFCFRCESCVDLLFVKGSGNCPECGTTLRRINYRLQIFEDPVIEKEVDIRKRILRE